jgi:amidohydrolase
MKTIPFIDFHQDLLLKTYYELHALAEPSWEEKHTSAYICQCLQHAGIKYKTFSSHYGIVAEIPGESNQVVALRADLDALVQEVDGVIKPNHSCGHDAHSTMVLFAALAIHASGIQPKHTLRFIFQPAEEKGEGALQMMEDGALDNVHYLFGIHVRPNYEIPYLKASPVIIHGAAATFTGTIKGLQAHASRPEDGINVLEAAALLIQKLKQIQLNTSVPYSIKMTKLNTENEASNVIPETAVFTLDVRAQKNEVMSELKQQTELLIEQIMGQTGTTIRMSEVESVPAATVNEKAINFAKSAIASILGEENVVPTCISNGGEDFHYYTTIHPLIAATMIGLGCDLFPGLHHPDMKFNVEALIYGAKILTQTILLASDQ